MQNIVTYHIAMCLIASTFLLSACHSIIHWRATLAMMQAKRLPFSKLGLLASLLLKSVAGIMLIVNFHVQIAAASLITFMVVVTIIFHNFWSMQGHERISHYFFFLTNICIVGGLLLVMSIN